MSPALKHMSSETGHWRALSVPRGCKYARLRGLTSRSRRNRIVITHFRPYVHHGSIENYHLSTFILRSDVRVWPTDKRYRGDLKYDSRNSGAMSLVITPYCRVARYKHWKGLLPPEYYPSSSSHSYRTGTLSLLLDVRRPLDGKEFHWAASRHRVKGRAIQSTDDEAFILAFK